MRWKSEEGREKISNANQHPDASKNHEWCHKVLAKVAIDDPFLTWSFEKMRPGTDIIDEPIHVSFYFHEGSRNVGNSLSFHLPCTEFKNKLMDILQYFLKRGMVKKKATESNHSPEKREKEYNLPYSDWDI